MTSKNAIERPASVAISTEAFAWGACKLPWCAARALEFEFNAMAVLRPLTVLVGFDDFSHGDAEFVFYYYDFAACDQSVINININRFAYFTI